MAGISSNWRKSAADCARTLQVEISNRAITKSARAGTLMGGSPNELLFAQRLNQLFLLLPGISRQRVERPHISPDSGGREQHKRFSRQPAIAGPAPQPQHQSADSKQQNLRAERDKHRHPRLSLPMHLP